MKDPGITDQLISLAVGVAAVATMVGLVVGWLWAFATAVLILIVGTIVVLKVFERRTLMLDGTTLSIVSSEGPLAFDVSEITRIDADEVFHVGKQVTITAGRIVVPDLEPSASKKLLYALGQILESLGQEGVCSSSARPYLGLPS